MKIKKGFVLERVGDSYLAIATGPLAASFKSLVKLNESGAFLWRCLEDGDLSLSELVSKMTDNYDIPESVAAADAERFVKNLESVGILES